MGMRKNDKEVEEVIREAERTIQEVKAQQVTGASSVVAYKNQSNNNYDVLWSPTSVGGFGYAQARITVTFTADRQVSAFTAITADIIVDGAPYTNSNDPFVYYVWEKQNSGNIDVAKYQTTAVIVVQSSANKIIQMKFIANSTDTGTLDVQFEQEIP